MIFAHLREPWEPDQLYIRSDWEPDPTDVPIAFRARISPFLRTLRPHFRGHRVSSNLTPLQRKLLATLENPKDFIVFPSDKNLGPSIIEQAKYIRRALALLQDQDTYRQLSTLEAETAIAHLKTGIENWIADHHGILSDLNRKFLWCSLEVPDPYAHFYITAKVHKNPWKPRPIVSVASSILHGRGRWVDRQIQPICRQLPTYLKSSHQLQQEIQAFPYNPKTDALFTADAVSMYTNIDTDHALFVISRFLKTSSLCSDINAEPIISALTIVMRKNIFKFGDTCWIQKAGTAMGAPPACMYATLYYAIWEYEVLNLFGTCAVFYKRYMDNIIGLRRHHADPGIDCQNWLAFHTTLQAFGTLEWTTTVPTSKVNFMDLTLDDPYSSQDKSIRKAMNLYLYIPVASAHPPGVLNGLIFGMVIRFHRLITDRSGTASAVQQFFSRLLARAHNASKLRPIFLEALCRVPLLVRNPRKTNKSLQQPLLLFQPSWKPPTLHHDRPAPTIAGRFLGHTEF